MQHHYEEQFGHSVDVPRIGIWSWDGRHPPSHCLHKHKLGIENSLTCHQVEKEEGHQVLSLVESPGQLGQRHDEYESLMPKSKVDKANKSISIEHRIIENACPVKHLEATQSQ